MNSVAAWGLLVGVLALQPAGAEEACFVLRDGLPNAERNLRPGNWMNAVWLGGAVAAGEGASSAAKECRNQTMSAIRTLWPGSSGGVPQVTGGRGSWWGAFCAARGQAVFGEHLPGSLMFCDLAGDDAGTDAEVAAAIEGVVRSVWGRAGITDLVFLYPFRPAWLEEYRQGRTPAVIAQHERVADHYGIPSVNLGRYVARKIVAGELTAEQVSADGVRPTDRGHALYAEALKAFLTAAKAAQPPGATPAPRRLPKPLTAAPLDQGRCVPYEVAKLDRGWQVGQASPIEPFRHVAVSNTPGATIELRVKADQIGVFEAAGADTADWECAVDNGPWQARPAEPQVPATGLRPAARRLLAGLDATAWHQVRLRLAAPAGAARTARLGVLLVHGEVADPYAGLTPLQRMDALYAGMDPLKYTPPADRWPLIGKTMARLREGGPLKMLFLGDSIMNQTSHSGYDLLLKRLYPKVDIQRVTSVRGSTGCWWYKDENRIEEYVLKHQPDLLLIGGISQRDDVDSIRACIQQVRAKQQPEILLLTPAFGFEKSAHIVNWTFGINPTGSDYRAKLLRLASEEKCELVDLTGPWWQYIKDSGKCYGWFRGDAVHANERGTMILARILEQWFQPK